MINLYPISTLYLVCVFVVVVVAVVLVFFVVVFVVVIRYVSVTSVKKKTFWVSQPLSSLTVWRPPFICNPLFCFVLTEGKSAVIVNMIIIVIDYLWHQSCKSPECLQYCTVC